MRNVSAHLAYSGEGLAAVDEIDVRSDRRSVDLNIALAAQVADVVVVATPLP